jgi:hypothetical protein
MSKTPQKRAKRLGPGQRKPLLSRTTLEMRDMLEAAAAQSGRSLGQEVEHRLERSFSHDRLWSLVFGEDKETAELLIAIGKVQDRARRYAFKRGFDEAQTRRAIKEAIKTILDIHLWSGGDIAPLPQTLFVEHGRIVPPPPMSPEQSGRFAATEELIWSQDERIDELDGSLVERWSKPGSLPPKPQEDEGPQDEWPNFNPRKAKKPSRKPSPKTAT